MSKPGHTSMTLRCPTPIELPPSEDLAEFLDWGLAHDEPQIVGDLLLVPDILVVEWQANGTGMPDTVRSVRADGRSVSVYFVVDGWGYGIRPVPADEDS